MVKDMIFGTVGGLGLFLFGMGLMSDGLKKVAGQKLKRLLEALTKHRIIAVIVGAITTCLIQSSSATTVMTVGFVNAGLLTLKQALCVVLGANVGTTITAGLVSVLAVFKITNYALPLVGVALQPLGPVLIAALASNQELLGAVVGNDDVVAVGAREPAVDELSDGAVEVEQALHAHRAVSPCRRAPLPSPSA